MFTGGKVAVERQMSTVKFYREDGLSQEKLSKIGYTPLTNSGCESNLGDLTYGITRGAGSDTKMKTFSDKNIIRKNRLFETKKWKMMKMMKTLSKVEMGKEFQPSQKCQENWKGVYGVAESYKDIVAGRERTQEKRKAKKGFEAAGGV